MIFQRLSRTDPERVFVVMQNNTGGAVAKDDACQLELASASIDGVKFRAPATGNLYGFVGVADAAMATADYGLVQIYGYRSSSKVFQTNTSQDTGQPLVPVAGQVYMATIASTFASNTSVTLHPVFAVLGESITDSAGSATVSRKIFIRSM